MVIENLVETAGKGPNVVLARERGRPLHGAALDLATGKVSAAHKKRRRRVEFLDFMNRIVADYPDKEIHVVLDNLNAHKPKNHRWLKRHPNVRFHFTPTRASWLNAVEGFFAKLTRRRLKRGVFRSVVNLQAAINRFVEETNADPKPFVWTADPNRVLAAGRRARRLCGDP